MSLKDKKRLSRGIGALQRPQECCLVYSDACDLGLLFVFGEGHLQNAVGILGRDALRLYILRQKESSQEGAILGFYPMIGLLVAFFLLELPFAGDHETAFRDFHFEVFLLHARRRQMDFIRFVGFYDVHPRHEGFQSGEVARRLVKHSFYYFLQGTHPFRKRLSPV